MFCVFRLFRLFITLALIGIQSLTIPSPYFYKSREVCFGAGTTGTAGTHMGQLGFLLLLFIYIKNKGEEEEEGGCRQC